MENFAIVELPECRERPNLHWRALLTQNNNNNKMHIVNKTLKKTG